jgi:hypothetical protein
MKKIFIIFIFISFYSSAKAQATLGWETTVRPEGSNLTSSEGNTITRDAFQDYKLNSHYSKKLGVFDLDVDANYNFTSVVPEYGALVQISNKF